MHRTDAQDRQLLRYSSVKSQSELFKKKRKEKRKEKKVHQTNGGQVLAKSKYR